MATRSSRSAVPERSSRAQPRRRARPGLDRTGAVLVDAISFLASGAFSSGSSVRSARRRARRQAGPGMKGEVRKGLRYVLGHRPALDRSSTATFNFFRTSSLHLPRLCRRELGIGPGPDRADLLPPVASATSRRAARDGISRGSASARRSSSARQGRSPLLLAAAPSLFDPVHRRRLGISALGIPDNITQVSFRQAITPERLQGRMNSVMRFVVWGDPAQQPAQRGARLLVQPARATGSARSEGRRPAGPALPGATTARMPEPVEEPRPSKADAARGVVPALGAAPPAAD